MQMKIEYSFYDVRRRIRLPKISDSLAEFFGILFGDGSVIDTERIHRIVISLNLKEDSVYKDYVFQLIKKLFGIEPKLKRRQRFGKLDLEISSKGISKFLLSLGYPNGRKKDKLIIPYWILENRKHLQLFLRGLVDTDGSLFFAKRGTYKLNEYPVIEIKMHDENFINQIFYSLKNLGFKVNKTKIKIQLNGKDNLQKWINEIGFRNLNLQSRYFLWKKLSYCPPKTKLRQRLIMLGWQKAFACNPVMHISKKRAEPPAERKIEGSNPSPSF